MFNGDSTYLADLNPQQRQAVCHGNGPLLIFAGAGSGKTRVLTRRMTHLILEHNIHPGEILAVTFTNKAAQEMKSRVGQLLGNHQTPSWVSTFHSSCARILRRYAEALGYTSSFAIYDSSDSLAVIKRVYKKLNIDPRMLDPKMVRAKIDRAKNDYKFPDSFREDMYLPQIHANQIADVYEAYQQELHTSNAMDFGDLICNTVTLFKLEPSILVQFQSRFRQVLIDEYQDTNKVQYKLIQMLVENHQNICVVGDDDQSIYAFRGATIQNILNFKKDFPEARVITLETNYRSTKTILTAANAVISQNKNRQKKSMKTDNIQGDAIVFYPAYNEKEEARFLTREITACLNKGASAKQIAVFYRTNAQSRAIEEIFCENSIPYEIFGGHRFYDRKEIKDVLAYFRLLINEKDDEAFLRIINTPTRGLGPTSVGALQAFASEKKLPLFRALRQAIAEKASFLTSANTKKFDRFLSLLDELKGDLEQAQELLSSKTEKPERVEIALVNSIAEVLKAIAEKSGYLDKLKKDDSPESQSRIENIYELMGVAAEFVRTQIAEKQKVDINNFLDRTSLSSDLDQENTKNTPDVSKKFDGKISLMTLHLAKGLEFDFVFLVGLEEGLLPHIRSFESKPALEEERRLCYVGITRARKKLFLSQALSREGAGRVNWNSGIPSRFLSELPRELLDERNNKKIRGIEDCY